MFKKGVIHGFGIVLFWVALGYLVVVFNLKNNPIGMFAGLAFFMPLFFIGYKYKSSQGHSPFSALLSGNTSILYYPAGIAIYTSAIATYTSHEQMSWSLVLFPVGIVGHGLSIATAIWVGSWFKS